MIMSVIESDPNDDMTPMYKMERDSPIITERLLTEPFKINKSTFLQF